MTGEVTYLNIKKKFGFIVSGYQDYYFNLKDVYSRVSLGKGATVLFQENEGHKGFYATNIVVIKASTSPDKPRNKSSNKMLVIGNIRIKKSDIKRYYSEDNYECSPAYYIFIFPYKGRKIYESFYDKRERDEALKMLDTEFC